MQQMARSTGAPADVWEGYSLAERDRRWNALRTAGSAAGYDCIFVPLGAGLDACYLTEIRGAVQTSCVALPTDGRDPVVAAEGGGSRWVPEPRRIRRAYAETVAQLLADAAPASGRIGV